MGLLSLEIIGFFTALIFLLEFGLRHEKADLLGIFEESLLLSLIPLGVLAYILDPQITTGVIIVSAYTPHAYNLIIWPSLSLLVLRKKFGSRLLIPALMFLYGLDEILWNVIAYLRFFGNTTVMIFLTIPYWQGFFAVMIAICIAGYLIVRPTIKPNLYWVAFIGYIIIYAWVFNMPVLQPLPASGIMPPLHQLIIELDFELGWQAAFWLFVYSTFWKRKR